MVAFENNWYLTDFIGFYRCLLHDALPISMGDHGFADPNPNKMVPGYIATDLCRNSYLYCRRPEVQGAAKRKELAKSLYVTLSHIRLSLGCHLHTIDFAWPHVIQFLELGYDHHINYIFYQVLSRNVSSGF